MTGLAHLRRVGAWVLACGRAMSARVGDGWLLLSWLGFFALVALVPRLALDSGITWDEFVQRGYGERVLAWYQSDFTDRSAFDYLNLYLYGGLFDLAAQWLLTTEYFHHWGPFETRHVLTALVSTLGVLATWKTAARLGGSLAGLVGALLLVLTPTWLGHSLFNPKDVPFAAATAFAIYATVSIARRPAPLSWGDATCAALGLGAALGVRPGGMFLVAFPAFAALARLIMDVPVRFRSGGYRSVFAAILLVVLKLALAVPIIWGLMLSAWPWAQEEPFDRPFEAAAIAAHFDWGGFMLFDGKLVAADTLPLDYLPIWFSVTLPETYLLAAASALVVLFLLVRRGQFERGHVLAVVCLLAFVVVPYVGVVIKRPVLYDAHRHFLFILSPMAALAGAAVVRFWREPALSLRLRAASAAGLALVALLVLSDMISLHPYQYVYFNRLSGGLRAAQGRFETDYWGASYREGFDWVVKTIHPRKGRRLRIAACSAGPQIDYYRNLWGVDKQYVLAKREEKADIYLSFTRNDCHKRSGRLVHMVERQGVPLLYVFRR